MCHDTSYLCFLLQGVHVTVVFFFFSSRRRHTRFDCDWSSDVCSSDLRSDYPNQVNNVLGFPFIFRGALDVRAKKINEEMEMAATRALAALAKEEVPDAVMRAYGLERLRFGVDYLIPKPFDPRVLLWVAPAVAWAAGGSGGAGRVIDVGGYRAQLDARLGRARGVMRGLSGRAQPQGGPRGGFSRGGGPRVPQAARRPSAE